MLCGMNLSDNSTIEELTSYVESLREKQEQHPNEGLFNCCFWEAVKYMLYILDTKIGNIIMHMNKENNTDV